MYKRQQLNELISCGEASARQIRRAYILLKSDSSEGDPNPHAEEKLVNKRLGNDHKVQVARIPAACSPMPDQYHQGTGTPRVGKAIQL